MTDEKGKVVSSSGAATKTTATMSNSELDLLKTGVRCGKCDEKLTVGQVKQKLTCCSPSVHYCSAGCLVVHQFDTSHVATK
jgi:hypothetical protein